MRVADGGFIVLLTTRLVCRVLWGLISLKTGSTFSASVALLVYSMEHILCLSHRWVGLQGYDKDSVR